jgi:hypothetical protein
VLESIYKLRELAHHFIIVVGEADQKVLSKVPKQTRLAFWEYIEAQGKAGTTICSPAPRKSLSIYLFHLHIACSPVLTQVRMMCLLSHIIGTSMARSRLNI